MFGQTMQPRLPTDGGDFRTAASKLPVAGGSSLVPRLATTTDGSECPLLASSDAPSGACFEIDSELRIRQPCKSASRYGFVPTASESPTTNSRLPTALRP